MLINRFIVFLLSGIIFLLSGCKSSKETGIACELSSIDSVLFTNPQQAFDRLDSISREELSLQEINYYGLLHVIAQENNFIKIRSDSAISHIYNYYKKNYEADSTNHNVLFDYARASLYYAIIKYNIKTKDTLVYPLLKRAQVILEKTISGPSYYLARVEMYLALVNSVYMDQNLADEYYREAFDEYAALGDKQSIALLKVDRALACMISRRYDLTLTYLKEIEQENLLLNDDIKYAYYNAYSAYYAATQNYTCAVKYSKLESDLKSDTRRGLDYSKIYFSVSKYYSFMNNVDSAILYANKAIECVAKTDAADERLHNYYRNAGDIYSVGKDYKAASLAYREAFIHALNSTSSFHKKRQKEQEMQYNIVIRKNKLERVGDERRILFLVGAVVILAFLLMLVLLLYKAKMSKVFRHNMEFKQQELEKELMQTKSMVDVVSVSLGVLPTFIDKVNDLSAKVFATDPSLYQVFQNEINLAKAETRKRLLNLVNNELLITTSPFLKYLDTLSNQEKMIVLLLRQNYSIKYVASILNISQSSVRGSKVKIKAKIKDLNLNDEVKNDILLGIQ